MPAHTRRGFAYVTGKESVEEGKAYLLEALHLGDVIDKVRVPVYLLHGRHDVIFSLRQLELLQEGLAGAPAEIVLEEDGDHCCHNMGQIVRPRMADWLVDRLQAQS
jgi:2,6-dihydroxypseudooxynicotine hydrolase